MKLFFLAIQFQKRQMLPKAQSHLQSIQQPLTLKHKHDLVHRAPHTRLLNINRQIRLHRSLIRIIDAREALDFTIARLGVDTALISLLGVLEAGSDVHEVKASKLLDQLTSMSARVFEWCDWGSDDGCACASEFGCDECDAADVAGAVCAAEAELGREFRADSLTQQKRDGAASLLVQCNVQGASDSVLAGILIASEEDGETLC